MIHIEMSVLNTGKDSTLLHSDWAEKHRFSSTNQKPE